MLSLLKQGIVFTKEQLNIFLDKIQNLKAILQGPPEL
jgi:hypothetical protein